MTSVGENVLVQTPVYNIFFNSIVNNGRNIVENKLLYDGKEYSIDFKDLENKLSTRERLEDGLTRLKKGIELFKKVCGNGGC